MHPTVIIQAFRQALEDAVAILGDEVGVPVDMDDEAQLVKVVQSSIGTKFISRWADLAVKIAIDAVKKVTNQDRVPQSGNTQSRLKPMYESPDK